VSGHAEIRVGEHTAKMLFYDAEVLMDTNEFNSKAVRTEDQATITFDVRPFGDKQGDAVDSYLHARLMALQMNAGGFGPRLVVLVCSRSARMPGTVNSWLAELNASGVATEIRPASRRTGRSEGVRRQRKKSYWKLSTTIAIPCPPPMQAVANPYFFRRRRNSPAA
jgi:hypothetical protein